MPMTARIYEADPLAARFTARVLSCAAAPGGAGWDIVLDATAFFPEGGGQPCDTGTLGGAAVSAVLADGAGTITHRTDAPLAPGTEVEGVLNWPARWDHMQQHTGEHILSGTLHRLFGCENVGFHIGQPAVRMDLDRPLTAAQLAEAELAANRAVQRDEPVHCWYPAAEELAATPYRSKKELDGAVRLVDIPGADCCACCGTHLARTGQVGLIKILSFLHYKGGMRLSVVCGERAVAAVCALHADATATGGLLSVPAGALAPAAERLLGANSALHQRVACLQTSLTEALCGAVRPGEPPVFLVNGPDGDGLRRLCLTAAAKAGAPCAVVAPGDAGLLYALAGAPPRAGDSGSESAADFSDIRPLCRALNQTFGGRGGGKAGFCQGSLPEGSAPPEKLAQFIRAYFKNPLACQALPQNFTQIGGEYSLALSSL